MSSIEQWYDNTFTLKRMTWSGDSSGLVSGTSFVGHIQQARPDFAEHIGESWNQTFVVWCDEATDVQEGDRLTVASGSYAGTYNVKNIQVNAVGRNKHFELTVIKKEQ